MPPSITAIPDFICTKPATPKSAQISYDSGSSLQIQIWEQITGNQLKAWAQRKLVDTTRGTYTSFGLVPGDKLDIAMLPATSRHFDPLRAMLLKSVFCGQHFVSPQWGVDEIHQEAGGTYYWTVLSTSVPTYCKIMIGEGPPTETPCSTPACPVFEFPIPPLFSYDGVTVASTHDVELAGLKPGTRYFCLIQLSDPSGGVKYISREFRTLRRKITTDIVGLFCIDDGDNLGRSDAAFKFDFYESAIPPAWPPLGYAGSLSFPATGRTTVDSGHIVRGFSPLKHVAGPKEGDWTIWMESRGSELDGALDMGGGGEYARFEFKVLQIPSGRGKEVVSEAPNWFVGAPYVGSFKYRAHVGYSITYEV